MAGKVSLKELFDEIDSILSSKNQYLARLNDSAYKIFRQIILYRDRNTEKEFEQFQKLDEEAHEFISKLGKSLPSTLAKITYNHEISAESKAKHKSDLLSTKGVNELLGLIEAIALELTREESYYDQEGQSKLKDFVERVKKLSSDVKEFINTLQTGIEVLPPAALYTLEVRVIGVALVIFYSFLVSFNISFIRMTKEKYEERLGLEASWEYYTDIFLPLLGIPGYIFLHYMATRKSLKYSFSISILLLIAGNLIYYAAEYFVVNKIDKIWFIKNPGLWFYLIGKGIIVSRLPLYGVKQFIGFEIERDSRVQISTCSVGAIFLGYSIGYFLSLTSLGYEGEFIGFTTTEDNIGGLFIGGFWIITFFFCSVLYLDTGKKFSSAEKGHKMIFIQVLTVISYTLPFVVLQLFVSNHARPEFEENWDDKKFFIFLGVFCLVALPVHIYVYISSHFTTDKTLILLYKLLIILAGPLYVLSEYSDVSKEFWYVACSLFIILGVNMGMGVSFAMLAGNIKNHRIGLFAGVLEVIGVVVGNFGAQKKNHILYYQIGVIALVMITFVLDLAKFKDFDPLKVKPKNSAEENEKKNN